MTGTKPLDAPAETKKTIPAEEEAKQIRETEYTFPIYGDMTTAGEFMAVLDHLCAEDQRFGKFLSLNELITLLRSQANILEAGIEHDL